MKKALTFILTILIMTTGCASQVQITESADVSDEKVPFASWENAGNNMQHAPIMIGDTLYYIESKWDESRGWYTEVSIYRKKREAIDGEMIIDLGDSGFVHYLVDETEALYYLYTIINGSETEYILTKTNKEGTVLYDVSVSGQGEAGQEDIILGLGAVTMGEVNSKGEVCLSGANGDLYLFDAEGNFLGTSSGGWNEESYHSGNCGLVNAGEEGIFTYYINGSEILFHRINMSNGKLDTEFAVQIDTAASDNLGMLFGDRNLLPGSLEIYSGYDMGILISDSDTLWKYDITDKDLTAVLEWGGSTINLSGYMIDVIGILHDESLYIRAHQTYEDVIFIHITYKDISEIPESQVVTLGVVQGYEASREELAELISKFNQISTVYKVEIQIYDSLMNLQLDLLKGDGPDIMSLQNLDISVLSSKGILENLSPCFIESDKVKETDLLPSVRNAWTVSGELVCIFPRFQINGFWVEKGTTEGGGWTTDEFVKLGEDFPEAALADYNPKYYHNHILRTAIKADMENYIDWQERKCYFDSDRFISLIERVSALEVPKSYESNIMSMDIYADLELFYQKELLTSLFAISSINNDWQIKRNGGIANGTYAEIAGYPNESGKPYYELLSTVSLGINSASFVKEGAWEFLEFLLSEEYQNLLTGFPVRQDSFNRYIALETIKVDLSDEDLEFIRYMADNAYWPQTATANTISVIISEETDPVWDGTKSAGEAAKIIQNRVTIYLNE